MAMAASMENGSLVSDSAPSANGDSEAAVREISQNGGVSDDLSTEVVDGGEQAGGGEGKKAREADRRRRRRNKKKKGPRKELTQTADQSEDNQNGDEPEENVVVEYISAKPAFEDADGNMDPAIQDFLRVFEKFSIPEEMFQETIKNNEPEETQTDEPKKKKSDSDESDDEDDEKDKEKGLSNKKKKLQRRMKIAELKQQCMKPDVVEGKRGIEKQPFQLPDFIAATGIEKIRQAYIEKEDSKKLKQKQREKMQPKMGKMDIDYQVLHDAFFKYQTKPKLTHHGDLYHEGKEFEVKLREMKPGQLSHELKEALGMPDGAPPPWLINMQRYGPPPSYPHLKIPGLNAPIPEGASFGYHAGGWGKPPVDEYGRPLYGDVFGVQQSEIETYEDEPVDRTKHWGDLEEEEEEEEEEDEDEEGAELGEDEMADGVSSVDTISTTPTGVETPDVIDLRKAQRKEPEKQLYHVLEEKEERAQGGTILGTSHTYVLPSGDKAAAKKGIDLLKSQRTDKVDITLRPEELEGLDDVALAAKYEEASHEATLAQGREDFSDLVAEVEKKRKRKAQEKDGKAKKQKDFKF